MLRTVLVALVFLTSSVALAQAGLAKIAVPPAGSATVPLAGPAAVPPAGSAAVAPAGPDTVPTAGSDTVPASSVALAHVGRRVALVIGVSDYQHAASLPNTLNDAKDMSAALTRLGFDVDTVLDPSWSELEAAVRRYGDSSAGAEASVFYYSGHALEAGGRNWILPATANINSERDLRFEAVDLNTVLEQTDGTARVSIAFLDACRDNPFAGRLSASARRLSRGLERVDLSTTGVLLAFSTAPGQVALDGVSAKKNSPFTAALLSHLETAGLEIKSLLARVTKDVVEETKGKQRPWQNSSLEGDFYFLPPPATTSAPAAQSAANVEIVFWDSIKGSHNPADFRAYLTKFPNGIFLELAQNRLAILQQPAIVAPPPETPCGRSPAVTVTFSSRPACPLSAGEEEKLKPKDTFKECDQCPEMVVVPAGHFTMGSSTGEPERFNDEGPQHQVTIGKAFAVGKFSVTFDEWDACVTDGGCNGYRPHDEGWGRGRRPVIYVSWDDASAYVAWLSRKTGKAYRFLSESEREYVTRAGTTTAFWWGSSVTTRQANYNGTNAYNKGEKGEFRNMTLPVGSFEPNPWGLYDVHGNVWDWVEDCFHFSYQGAPADGTAWTTGDCNIRVLRGGSWWNPPTAIRAASRFRNTADTRFIRYGLRLATTLTQ